MNSAKLAALFGLSLIVTSQLHAASEPRDENAGEAPTYSVSCAANAASAGQCEVDNETYIGWRTYAATCQVCHGGGGLGSTFAPNLLTRMNQEGVDYARFLYVLEKGYTGTMGAMPAWESNNNVMKNRDNLYKYLRARADEKLPNGRPKRMK